MITLIYSGNIVENFHVNVICRNIFSFLIECNVTGKENPNIVSVYVTLRV